MLNPDIRHLLTDALRPPTGFRLDAAIATTYSLAIESLLLAPLSMAAYEQGEGGLEGAAPHELLEAIRRYAERTTVFCQAGGIHVPTTYSKLTVFAEDSILEVAPPAGRVFHPKIWVLRYINAADDLTHRFVCMSRNLTGDRSWDTVLMTDEDSAATHQMPAAPLSAFLEDLLHDDRQVGISGTRHPHPERRRITAHTVAGGAVSVHGWFTASARDVSRRSNGRFRRLLINRWSSLPSSTPRQWDGCRVGRPSSRAPRRSTGWEERSSTGTTFACCNLTPTRHRKTPMTRRTPTCQHGLLRSRLVSTPRCSRGTLAALARCSPALPTPPRPRSVETWSSASS